MNEMKHKAEEMLGKAKEKVGDTTNDEDLQAEGSYEESKADVKQAGDKVKDAFKK